MPRCPTCPTLPYHVTLYRWFRATLWYPKCVSNRVATVLFWASIWWYRRYSFISVRLAGGVFKSEGRVEVLHDDTWGTVCNDLWDDLDAKIVCRQLGYRRGVVLASSKFEKATSGPIWLDDVECSGNEIEFESCSARPWGDHDCSHYEDAGVRCSWDIQLLPLKISVDWSTASVHRQILRTLSHFYFQGWF